MEESATHGGGRKWKRLHWNEAGEPDFTEEEWRKVTEELGYIQDPELAHAKRILLMSLTSLHYERDYNNIRKEKYEYLGIIQENIDSLRSLLFDKNNEFKDILYSLAIPDIIEERHAKIPANKSQHLSTILGNALMAMTERISYGREFLLRDAHTRMGHNHGEEVPGSRAYNSAAVDHYLGVAIVIWCVLKGRPPTTQRLGRGGPFDRYMQALLAVVHNRTAFSIPWDTARKRIDRIRGIAWEFSREPNQTWLDIARFHPSALKK